MYFIHFVQCFNSHFNKKQNTVELQRLFIVSPSLFFCCFCSRVTRTGQPFYSQKEQKYTGLSSTGFWKMFSLTRWHIAAQRVAALWWTSGVTTRTQEEACYSLAQLAWQHLIGWSSPLDHEDYFYWICPKYMREKKQKSIGFVKS